MTDNHDKIGSRVGVATSFCLLFGSLLIGIVLPNSMPFLACLLALASLRRERSLVSAFFLLASMHCILGYFLAFRSASHIFSDFNHYDSWFGQAAFVVSLGLIGVSIGYQLSDHNNRTWVNYLSIDENKLRIVAKVAVILGAATIFYMYSRFSFIQALLENLDFAGRLRYLGSESLGDIWIASKALDVLTYSLPLLWVIRKDKTDYLTCVVGLTALFLTLRRASLLSVLLVPLLVKSEKVNFRKLAFVFLGCISLYSASQIAFLDMDKDGPAAAVASAFPEVRDLGWIMALMHGDYLYGATFVQPFDPLPAFASNWKQTHTMQYVTASLLGFDPSTNDFAGLRLTMAGEAYMNFWMLGPPLLALLLGFGIAWSERALKFSVTVPIRYLSATIFLWFSFWLYMGGTQALGTIKFGAIILFVMYAAARKQVPTLTPEIA
jgi:hypothetical protein